LDEQKQLQLENTIRVKEAVISQYKDMLSQSLEYTAQLELEVKMYQAALNAAQGKEEPEKKDSDDSK